MKINDKKLLLHACCGPCSTTALERLSEDYCVTVFYYNPNIAPHGEYNLRRDEAKRFSEQAYGGKVLFVEGRYEPDVFLKAVKGFEKEPEGGFRCEICFRLRLEETARYAKDHGFSLFCTTLTVSPYKNALLINKTGEDLAVQYNGLTYLPSDFKKRNGFRRSIELSQSYNIYRQNYCGCIFSLSPSSICKGNA
ncbi:MAG: epoxyqueuosine reductase QueH [Bacteroidales bacterium]|jgi:predicted adenine nucleotide alpha hydrolase (AANH) superfamily ATPase|nr:epoxyqueuosine reductase QueH [Bacteroidales bacterium]